MSGQQQRRRPPKMRSTDRSHSVVVDNYMPLTSAALSAKRSGTLVINMDEPNMQRRKSSLNMSKEEIQQITESFDFHQQQNVNYPPEFRRKASCLRREKTIDFPSTFSSSASHLKQIDDGEISLIRLTPRTRNSIRPTTSHDALRNPQVMMNDEEIEIPERRDWRRINKMHFSFHDAHKQKRSTRTCDMLKSNSLSSDEHLFQNMGFNSRQPQNTSPLENDENRRFRNVVRKHLQVQEKPDQHVGTWMSASPTLLHTRRYSISPARPSVSSHNVSSDINQGLILSPRPSTSGLHQQQQQQQQPKKLKYQTTISDPQFLSPNQLELHNINFQRRKSQSVRYKDTCDNGKENRERFRSRKSQSFINDHDGHNFPIPLESSSPLPQRERQYYLDDIKRLSGDGFNMLAVKNNNNNNQIDNEEAFPIEFGTLGFNTIYQSYREKQKLAGSINKKKRKRSSQSISVQEKAELDFEIELAAKRRKVVCFVMIVFLTLIMLAVTAVLVTLTHSTETHSQNQTRQVYTFSRDSRPIHFGGGGGSPGSN